MGEFFETYVLNVSSKIVRLSLSSLQSKSMLADTTLTKVLYVCEGQYVRGLGIDPCIIKIKIVSFVQTVYYP